MGSFYWVNGSMNNFCFVNFAFFYLEKNKSVVIAVIKLRLLIITFKIFFY